MTTRVAWSLALAASLVAASASARAPKRLRPPSPLVAAAPPPAPLEEATAPSAPVQPSVAPTPAQTGRRVSLAEALGLTRARLPELRRAASRVAVAHAQADLAGTAQLPRVSLSAGGYGFASRGSFTANGADPAQDTQVLLWGELGSEVRWTLWDFGRTSNGREAAEHGARASEHEARAARHRALAEAAIVYLAVVADDDLVEVARATLRNQERQLETVRALAAGGARSEFDVRRAQLARDSGAAELLRVEAQRRSDGIALALALGLDATERLVVAAPALAGPASRVAASPVERPELSAARAGVERALSLADAARAGHAPVVELEATGGLRYTSRVGTPGGSPAQVAQGALVVTVPLLDFAVGARVRAADASVAENVAQLDAARARAGADTAHAEAAVASAEAYLQQAESLARDAAATLAHAEARYRAGFAALLDVLDAQSAEAGTRAGLVRARLARDVARVRLLAAAGKVELLAGDT